MQENKPINKKTDSNISSTKL